MLGGRRSHAHYPGPCRASSANFGGGIVTDLRGALVEMSERGSARGADAVIDAAEAQAARHRLRAGEAAPTRPRSWRRRIRRAAAAVAAVSILVAGATFVYIRHKLDDVTQ